MDTVKRWIVNLGRRIMLRRPCPCCGELGLKWVKVWIVHPEEPPLFGYWTCVLCNRPTDTMPSNLSIEAARHLEAEGRGNAVTRAVLEDAARIAVANVEPTDDFKARCGLCALCGGEGTVSGFGIEEDCPECDGTGIDPRTVADGGE